MYQVHGDSRFLFVSGGSAAGEVENLTVDWENAAVDWENAAVGDKNASGGDEKTAVGKKTSGVGENGVLGFIMLLWSVWWLLPMLWGFWSA